MLTRPFPKPAQNIILIIARQETSRDTTNIKVRRWRGHYVILVVHQHAFGRGGVVL